MKNEFPANRIYFLNYNIMNFKFNFGKLFAAIVFIATLAAPQQSSAQSNYEDVVYLKNGSIIRGMIIEQVPNESIKIQTKDRNVFVFKMDEVLKLTKEEVQPAVQPSVSTTAITNEPPKPKVRKTSGYTNITEMTFARSFNNTESTDDYGYSYPYESHFDHINNGPCFGIQTVNGYLFNPYFSLGLGIGMQAYNELFLVPLFLDLRANFIEGKVTPFVAAEIGNSFTRHQFFGVTTNYQDEGGFMGSVAGGVKFFPAPRMALNFSIGFSYQELNVENSYSLYNYNPDYSDRTLNQFTIRGGFTF
jgi:hypothetical protein